MKTTIKYKSITGNVVNFNNAVSTSGQTTVTINNNQYFALEDYGVVTFTDEVYAINANFCNSTDLEEIWMPDEIVNINANSFIGCTSLSTLYLSKNCAKIENGAFDTCVSLNEIFSYNTMAPAVSATSFNDETEIDVYHINGSNYDAWFNMFSNMNNNVGELTSQIWQDGNNVSIDKDGVYSYRVNFGGIGFNNTTVTDDAQGANIRVVGDHYYEFTCLSNETFSKKYYTIRVTTNDGIYNDCLFSQNTLEGKISLSEYNVDVNVSGVSGYTIYAIKSITVGNLNISEINDTGHLAESGVTSGRTYFKVNIPFNLNNDEKDYTFVVEGESGAMATCVFHQESALGKWIVKYKTTDGEKLSINNPNFGTGVTVIQHKYESGYGFYYLSSKPTKVGGTVFQDIDNLTYIDLLNTVTEIESYAFLGCVNLETVVGLESVTQIGESAFGDCTSLNIDVPPSLENVGNYAFSGCTNLKNITLNKYITTAGIGSFKNAQVFNVKVNDGAIIQGDGFFENSNITSIVIPKSMNQIPDNYFKNCTNLKEVHLTKNIMSIGHNAFSGCTNLTKIICDGLIAPTLENDSFSNIGSQGWLDKPEFANYSDWTSALANYNWNEQQIAFTPSALTFSQLGGEITATIATSGNTGDLYVYRDIFGFWKNVTYIDNTQIKIKLPPTIDRLIGQIKVKGTNGGEKTINYTQLGESPSITLQQKTFDTTQEDYYTVKSNIPSGCNKIAVLVDKVNYIWTNVKKTSFEYVLYYKNLKGGWDSILLNRASVKGENITINSAINKYKSDEIKGGTSQYQKDIVQTWTLKTDYMTTEQSEKMVNVIRTNDAYLQKLGSLEMIKVNVVDTQKNYHTFFSNGRKPIRYEIKLEATHKKISR